MNSMFEEDANLPVTGLYAIMAVSLLVQIILLARGLRNRAEITSPPACRK